MNQLTQIRSYVLVPLSLCIFLMVSCGQVKTTSYFTPTKTKLNQFQAVQFDNFVTEIEDFPKEALVKVPTESAQLLASKNKFKEVKHGEIVNIPATDTIVVLGEISEYRPSSDLSYESGAVKFGEVSVTVKFAQAETYYRRAVKIADSPELHYYLGTSLMYQGYYEEAINQFNEAIQLNPDYAAAHMYLGITYYYKNKLDEAIANEKRAISLNPNNPDAYFFMAQSYDKAGNRQQAVAYYRKFLELTLGQDAYKSYADTSKQRIAQLGGSR